MNTSKRTEKQAAERRYLQYKDSCLEHSYMLFTKSIRKRDKLGGHSGAYLWSLYWEDQEVILGSIWNLSHFLTQVLLHWWVHSVILYWFVSFYWCAPQVLKFMSSLCSLINLQTTSVVQALTGATGWGEPLQCTASPSSQTTSALICFYFH